MPQLLYYSVFAQGVVLLISSAPKSPLRLSSVWCVYESVFSGRWLPVTGYIGHAQTKQNTQQDPQKISMATVHISLLNTPLVSPRQCSHSPLLHSSISINPSKIQTYSSVSVICDLASCAPCAVTIILFLCSLSLALKLDLC